MLGIKVNGRFAFPYFRSSANVPAFVRNTPFAEYCIARVLAEFQLVQAFAAARALFTFSFFCHVCSPFACIPEAVPGAVALLPANLTFLPPVLQC